MKKFSKIYVWIVRHVPTSLLHVLIPFLMVVVGHIFSLGIGIALAIGASLGRESVRLPQLADKVIRDDTLRDLFFDAVGIALGILIFILI